MLARVNMKKENMHKYNWSVDCCFWSPYTHSQQMLKIHILFLFFFHPHASLLWKAVTKPVVGAIDSERLGSSHGSGGRAAGGHRWHGSPREQGGATESKLNRGEFGWVGSGIGAVQRSWMCGIEAGLALSLCKRVFSSHINVNLCSLQCE